MDGFQILRTRKGASKGELISQQELAKALGLSSRNTLTDVENGSVPVKEDWAWMVIAKIQEIRDKRSGTENAA